MLNYTIIRSKKYSIFANYNLLSLIGLLFFLNACTLLHHKKIKEQSSLSHISFSVEEAPEWSALFKRTNGWYGGDGIVYVYGIKGKQKNVVVARVLPQSFDDFANWHFWDGKEWNTDINQLLPL